MATSRLTVTDIRTFLMDKKELNPLLRGVRWDDKDVDQAVIMAVNYYNETPPLNDIQRPETFAYPYTLLMGVAGHLLKSASINQASNQLDYSLDGVSVQDSNKAEIFQSIGQRLWEEFKEKVVNLKIAANVAIAFGGLPSELAYVAR